MQFAGWVFTHRARPICACREEEWSHEPGWRHWLMMDELLTSQGCSDARLKQPINWERPALVWRAFSNTWGNKWQQFPVGLIQRRIVSNYWRNKLEQFLLHAENEKLNQRSAYHTVWFHCRSVNKCWTRLFFYSFIYSLPYLSSRTLCKCNKPKEKKQKKTPATLQFFSIMEMIKQALVINTTDLLFRVSLAFIHLSDFNLIKH